MKENLVYELIVHKFVCMFNYNIKIVKMGFYLELK